MPMLTPCRKAIAEGRKPSIAEIKLWRAEMDKQRAK